MKKYLRFAAAIAIMLVMAISMSSCATTVGLALLAGTGILDLSPDDDSNQSIMYRYAGDYYGTGEYDTLVAVGLDYHDSPTLVIPAYADYNGENCHVYSVARDAFGGIGSIESLVIEDGVVGIEDGAFYDCSMLTNVDLGSVSYIGTFAFADCNLETVVIPRYTMRVEDSAFANNYHLTTVMVPEDIDYLDYFAFDGCGNVHIKFQGSQERWERLAESCDWESACPPGVAWVEFDIPYEETYSDSVDEGSGSNDFFMNIVDFFDDVFDLLEEFFGDLFEWIEDIMEDLANPASEGLEYCPDSESEYAQNLGYSGFLVCDGMGSCTDSEIVIANNHEGKLVIGIDEDAFKQEYSITKLKIKDGVEFIGAFAFLGCKNLEYVDLAHTITTIDAYAFARCDALSHVALPRDTRYVGEFAFSDNPNLERVTVPADIEYLDYYAFLGCENVVISYAGSMEQWEYLAERSNWEYSTPEGVSEVHYETWYGGYED